MQTIIKFILAISLCINLVLSHAGDRDAECPSMQFNSKPLNRSELRSNIIEMKERYGDYPDIINKLIHASANNAAVFDTNFFEKYGPLYMNMSISIFEKKDIHIIKYLYNNGVSPLSTAQGERAPILGVVLFERTNVLELFFEEGLVLNKCQISELYDSAKLLKNASIMKILEEQN